MVVFTACKGWCSGGNYLGPKEYVQVDLCSTKIVTKVATQGRANHDNWMKKYSLSFSQDGAVWSQYNGGGAAKMVFNGNEDRHTVVTHALPVPIKARYIRVVPELNHGWTAMRFELYGC
ncbi:Retinoschisin [Exaiptasia diaphana]|nr:Retinoschisin [Exaiptasia diaphana]